MILSKTKVNADGAAGDMPVCMRCLYIRYFLLCVLVIALLGLLAGDALNVITALTPMHFALGVVMILGLIASIRAYIEWRFQGPSEEESRDRTGRTANS